jgi:ABC-type multidrug transport system ATPase subunit
MSEEILKALMQLFAIIAQQDSEQFGQERLYVQNFLHNELNLNDVNTYLKLFDEQIEESRLKAQKRKNSKLTSMTDSVRILKICKRINKTLDHKQKIISTIRLLEMISEQEGEQRMGIIHTIAEVFNIDLEEFEDLRKLVFSKDKELLPASKFIVISGAKVNQDNYLEYKKLEGQLIFLHIESANLYLVKYSGDQELMLNGLTLSKNQSFVFNPGSTIKTPVSKPIYFSSIFESFNKDQKTAKISFVAENISYKFNDTQIGLQPLNIYEQQNSLVAIMGASGSGKSTLLSVLSGSYTPTTGSVRINNIDLHKEKEKLEGAIGFIPQDDLLIENLTVFENLYFNTKFCYNNKSKEELIELVNSTLESLDLYEIKDLQVGSVMNKLISGGQRKRLNIALELIREPSILFVDEPTSGLSSRDSENVMDLLRKLSHKGKLIFVVIHQPSSDIYKIFDKVILLDEGGYMIQYGNPVEIISYFKKEDGQASYEQAQCASCGNVNAEQLFNIIHREVVDEYGNYNAKRKKEPKDWNGLYLNQTNEEKISEENSPPDINLDIPSKLKQTWIYFQRDLKSKISNKAYLLIAFLEAPILAFILSYIIRYIPTGDTYIFRLNENMPQYIFMSIIVAMFIGLTISAEEIIRDQKILKREAFLNLSKTAYLLAKISILLLISTIQSLLFIVIGNSVLGIAGMGFSYWLTFFSVSVFSNLLGLIISSSFDEVVTIYIIIPLLIIPQMVLGGAMFSFDKMNNSIVRVDKVPIIAEAMVSKWAYEGLMVNQFVNNKFEKYFYDLEKEESRADFHQVYYIPELKKYLKSVEKNFGNSEYSESLTNNIELLNNEYSKQSLNYPELKNNTLEVKNPKDINANYFYSYHVFIKKLDSIYNYEFYLAHNRLSMKLNQYLSTQKDKYYALRNKYHNEAISDIVTQFYEKNKILNYNNNLVQHVDAVYTNPNVESPIDIRSHLFAPKKHFLGKFYETFSFNISIIWLFNLLLFFILRTNGLRRLLQFKFNSNKY